MVKKTIKSTLKHVTKKASHKRVVVAKRIKTNRKKSQNKILKKQLSGSSRSAGLAEKLREAALTILNDRKAEEITVFDLRKKSSETDYLIIASGHAARQVSAIAHYLKEEFIKIGIRDIRIEGLPQANWVLVDAGDVIVHLFRPEVRQYYNLESIWDSNLSKKRSRN